jgi:hypothetical protein
MALVGHQRWSFAFRAGHVCSAIAEFCPTIACRDSFVEALSPLPGAFMLAYLIGTLPQLCKFCAFFHASSFRMCSILLRSGVTRGPF